MQIFSNLFYLLSLPAHDSVLVCVSPNLSRSLRSHLHDINEKIKVYKFISDAFVPIKLPTTAVYVACVYTGRFRLANRKKTLARQTQSFSLFGKLTFGAILLANIYSLNFSVGWLYKSPMHVNEFFVVVGFKISMMFYWCDVMKQFEVIHDLPKHGL